MARMIWAALGASMILASCSHAGQDDVHKARYLDTCLKAMSDDAKYCSCAAEVISKKSGNDPVIFDYLALLQTNDYAKIQAAAEKLSSQQSGVALDAVAGALACMDPKSQPGKPSEPAGPGAFEGTYNASLVSNNTYTMPAGTPPAQFVVSSTITIGLGSGSDMLVTFAGDPDCTLAASRSGTTATFAANQVCTGTVDGALQTTTISTGTGTVNGPNLTLSFTGTFTGTKQGTPYAGNYSSTWTAMLAHQLGRAILGTWINNDETQSFEFDSPNVIESDAQFVFKSSSPEFQHLGSYTFVGADEIRLEYHAPVDGGKAPETQTVTIVIKGDQLTLKYPNAEIHFHKKIDRPDSPTG